MKFLTKSLVTAVIILSSWNSITAQFLSSNDTLLPAGIITPYNADLTDPINFPLQNAEPVGDINGDGFEDFYFVKLYAGDERSPFPGDMITKSLVVTNIDHPKSGYVMYGSSIVGIGDYNGDGFDDMVDLENGEIWFGNAAGADFTSIDIEIPFEETSFYFKGDINHDGKSDFLLGKRYLTDTMYVYSMAHETPVIVKQLKDWVSFNISYTLFTIYDYDQDGEKEFCISDYDYPGHNYVTGWYTFDSTQNVYSTELKQQVATFHGAVQSFPSAFSDINGDGFLDICHAFYGGEDFKMEVHFGSSNPSAYFGSPVEIRLGNSTPYFYHAGDFNQDGADDWYSKTAQDTLVLYLGGADIVDQGFTKVTFPLPTNQLVIPDLISPNSHKRAGVFDYNQDAIPDILLNYWSYDNNLQYDTLGTAIFLGGPEIDFSAPELLITPVVTSFQSLGFGSKVKNIGDYNQDGFDDWAILSPTGCKAEIYFGGQVLDYNPDITIVLPQNPLLRCFDFAVGDLNGDSLLDIVISNSSREGIWYYSNMINESENVYVYLGIQNRNQILTWEDASIILDGMSSFYEFGYNLNIVGDYNGDGFNDLVVGGGTHKEGINRAFVYFGGEQISEEPDLLLDAEGHSWTYHFADPISACGDINGDGWDDFALGNSSNEIGKSLVYYGGPTADDEFDLAIAAPGSARANFGKLTSKVKGDFTGNGYPDLIQYDQVGGLFYVYQGGPEFDDEPDYFLSDTTFGGTLSNIEFVTDFSHRNQADLLVCDQSANGNTGMFFGTTLNKREVDLVLKNDWYIGSGISSGDFNKDGFTDLLIGNPFESNFGYEAGGVVQRYTNEVILGIDDNKNCSNGFVTIYPNPAMDVLNFKCDFDSAEDLGIQVFDSRGQLILMSRFPSGHSEKQLNISSLKTGFYLLKLSYGKSVQTERIVIQ